MADWPKHLLEKASKVRIESEGHAWEMTGAEMVGCLEAGGWVSIRPLEGERVDPWGGHVHGEWCPDWHFEGWLGGEPQVTEDGGHG